MLRLSFRINKAACFCSAVLCFYLISGRPVLALGQERIAAEKRFGPLEKSLLIPGWGQISEKRYVEGAAFLAAEAFCLYEIFANNHLGNENYASYKKAETMDDAVRFRQLTEKFDARRNQFLLTAAAVWAANLVDIYLIVKNKGKKEKTFTLRIERGEHQQISLTASCRF
jgi:hypothetical protein